jgi:outer membrane protein OmpA-like peptidoglycan-associated protein
MIGQPDDSGREPTDRVARIWQLYADEIGLPDASAAAQTVPTLQPANVPPPAPPQRRPRRMRVRLGVATVAAVGVAAALVIGLERRTQTDSRAHPARSADPGPAKAADSDVIPAAPTALLSDGRPTVPLSVRAPGEAIDRGRVDQPAPAAGSPSTSVTRPILSPDTGAAPASQKAAAEIEPRSTLPYRIMFDFNSDVLTAESRRTLEKVAVAMKANQDWQLMIAGHTDTHGPPAYNMALSQHRAEAAKVYLESSGISGQRLRVSGFAGSRPLAANDGPLTFLNRRVEFHRR